ncbi:MAG: transcriptional regulator FtsR [Jatrophihabitans sp.]|uniref:transcriptional regulator FtsR n=1 Tax=Jatrophihabitans sp. TaxID=1932789 RepID=UPI003F8073CB
MSAALNARSSSGTGGSGTFTIGDVLAALRGDFADLTISKIRFLEAEGLVRPERTPAGYRKFSAGDVERLRFVLSQQRDNYLPLRVIKEQLDKVDRGLAPAPWAVSPARPATQPVDGATAESSGAPRRLTREELLQASGLRADQLIEIEQFGLIGKRPGGAYDDDALTVAKLVADLGRFGLEGRHLRAFRTAAEREVGLFSQVVGPMARQRSSEARARAEETVRELASLSIRLHAALVQVGLREALGGA